MRLRYLVLGVVITICCSCSNSPNPHSKIIEEIVEAYIIEGHPRRDLIVIDIKDSTLIFESKNEAVVQERDSLLLLFKELISKNKESRIDPNNPFSRLKSGFRTMPEHEVNDFNVLTFKVDTVKEEVYGYEMTALVFDEIYFSLNDSVYYIEISDVLITKNEWRLLNNIDFYVTNETRYYLNELTKKKNELKEIERLKTVNYFKLYGKNYDVKVVRKFHEFIGKTLLKAFVGLSNESIHRIDSIYYDAVLKKDGKIILSKYAWLEINLGAGETETFEIPQFENQFIGVDVSSQSGWDYLIYIHDFEPKEYILSKLNNLEKEIFEINAKLDSLNLIAGGGN